MRKYNGAILFQMPDACGECPFAHQGRCFINWEELDHDILVEGDVETYMYQLERPKWCPIIDLDGEKWATDGKEEIDWDKASVEECKAFRLGYNEALEDLKERVG